MDQNGEEVECIAEAFTNTYQVFILILVRETIKKKSVIIPTTAEAVIFG